MVGDHFRLEWGSTSDAAGYAVYIGLTPGVGPGNLLQRLPLPLSNALEITGLTAGQTYFITIAATNAAGAGARAAVLSGVYGPKVVFSGRAVRSFLLPTGAAFEVLAEGTVFQLVRAGGGDGVGYQVTVDALGEFNLQDLPAGSYLISYLVNGQWVLLPAPARINLPSGPSPPPPGTTLLGYLRLSTGDPARISVPQFGLNAQAQMTVQFGDGSTRLVIPDRLGAWAVPQITGGFPVTITATYQGLTTVTTIAAPPAVLTVTQVQFPQPIPEVQRVSVQQNGQEVFQISPGVPFTFNADISSSGGIAPVPHWYVEYNGVQQFSLNLSPTFTLGNPGDTTGGTAHFNIIPSTYLWRQPTALEIPVVPAAAGSGDNCWSGIVGSWHANAPNDIQPIHSATVTVTHAGAGSPAVVNATINPDGVTWFDTTVNPVTARPWLVRVDNPGTMRFLWPFEFLLPKESTYCVVPYTPSTHSQTPGNTLTVTHPSGASVQIPYGVLRIPGGLAGNFIWTGDVVVRMTAWDAETRSPLPPNAESRTPGSRRGIVPFSCVWCELTTPAGQTLLTTGCTLTLPTRLDFHLGYPCFYQNEDTGYFEPAGDENGEAVRTANARFTTPMNKPGLYVLATDGPLMEAVPVADRSINYPFDVLVGKSIFPVTVVSPGATNFGHLYLTRVLGATLKCSISSRPPVSTIPRRSSPPPVRWSR